MQNKLNHTLSKMFMLSVLGLGLVAVSPLVPAGQSFGLSFSGLALADDDGNGGHDSNDDHGGGKHDSSDDSSDHDSADDHGSGGHGADDGVGHDLGSDDSSSSSVTTDDMNQNKRKQGKKHAVN
jgi:hypothetical protein